MNDEHRRIFKEYLEEESLRGHTEKGLRLLRAKVPKVFEYLEQIDLRVSEMKVSEAQGFQGWLLETGKKDGGKYQKSTILTYIKVAASFYEFLKRSGIVYSNPFKEIKRVREEKKLPRNILKEKQMALLLEALSKWDEEKGLKRQITAYKVHVIAELQYSTGLRISEVADLKPEDIDFEKGIINVREGKGGVSRTCWLNDYSKELIKLYLEKARSLTFSQWHERNGELLFGTPWFSLEKLVNKTLNKVSAILGLGRVTSHGFRHALGYHLLRAGCNIRHIQQILGHKHLKNTEVYTKVEKEDLKELLDTFHPRQFRKD